MQTLVHRLINHTNHLSHSRWALKSLLNESGCLGGHKSFSSSSSAASPWNKVPGRECSLLLSQPAKRDRQATCLNLQPQLVFHQGQAKSPFSTTPSVALFGLWGKKSTSPPNEAPVAATADATAPPPPEVEAASAAADLSSASGYIPEPPAILDEDLVLNALGEPTFQSLGLGSNWTPSGWIQSGLEFMHVDLDLPWFQAIALFAVALRLMLIPMTIGAQKNAVLMRKVAPQMAQLNERLNEARLSGNHVEVARRTHEMQQFMQTSGFGVKNVALPFVQFPIVISAFIAIRSMAKLPVESLTVGGLYWFTDLTIPDPYYILPVLASASILAIVYRGIDTGVSSANMSPAMRAAVYGFSLVSFPFFIFMPSAVSLYLCSTNATSLVLSVILSQPAIKRAFKIPIPTPAELEEMKQGKKKQKDFITGIRESIKNQRLMAEVKDRERLREKQFQNAANRVQVKTFKSNPLDKKKPTN